MGVEGLLVETGDQGHLDSGLRNIQAGEEEEEVRRRSGSGGTSTEVRYEL